MKKWPRTDPCPHCGEQPKKHDRYCPHFNASDESSAIWLLLELMARFVLIIGLGAPLAYNAIEFWCSEFPGYIQCPKK